MLSVVPNLVIQAEAAIQAVQKLLHIQMINHGCIPDTMKTAEYATNTGHAQSIEYLGAERMLVEKVVTERL